MTKSIIFILSACIYSLASVAQIGINTDNPKTLVHIDGASSAATTNPPTGTISGLQASDDVVVSADGRIGIGTLTPSARLDILSPTPGALRVADGSQRSFRMLISDSNGVLSWTSAMGTWFASLTGTFPSVFETTFIMKPITGYSQAVISDAGAGAVNATTGIITVPYTGYYRITLGGHWGCSRTGAGLYKIRPHIYVNGGYQAVFQVVGNSSDGLSPTFIKIMHFNANDNVMVYNDQRGNDNANQTDQVFFDVEYIE